jgi:hypothetical protein
VPLDTMRRAVSGRSAAELESFTSFQIVPVVKEQPFRKYRKARAGLCKGAEQHFQPAPERTPRGMSHLGALLEKDPLVVDGEHHRQRRLMPFLLHTAPHSDRRKKELQRSHAVMVILTFLFTGR